MSVRNAGATIREARLKAGLSQEKLSDGICSVLSLSRIENGTAGVSPSTFQALMAHAGAPCEAFPVFASRKDFDCFYTLKRVRFYLDYWQLNDAYSELEKIEQMNFAENKYYYQEWLLLHCKLQFRSGCGIHAQIYQTLVDALHISRPQIDFSDFRELLLSLSEIELLTAIAQEALYLNQLETCLEICTQISTYLENSQISFLERDHLLAENAIVYTKYLIATKDYSSALKIADTFKNKMITNSVDAPLHELTFLIGLTHYYLNDKDIAMQNFKTTFFSAHSISSCYATICKNYLISNLQLLLPEGLLTILDVPLVFYETKDVIDSSDFSDGTYDIFSNDILTIGTLIRELRIEQNVSQQTLCYGLCSKSKLSKIENGTLQPDISLAQTLLQRLGISDTAFTFFGNAHETNLQNLLLKLKPLPFSESERIVKYSNEMHALCTPKDLLYLQYATYKKANSQFDNSQNLTELLQSLSFTLPDFHFDELNKYRLSWLELTILNNYCTAQCQIQPSKGILLFYKLLNYYDTVPIDVLEKRRFFAVTLGVLIRYLFDQHRYTEIIDLHNYFSSPALKCSLNFTGLVYSHYAQALWKLKKKKSAVLYANYAYYNLQIIGLVQAANSIKKAVDDDFQILL